MEKGRLKVMTFLLQGSAPSLALKNKQAYQAPFLDIANLDEFRVRGLLGAVLRFLFRIWGEGFVGGERKPNREHM